MAFGTLTLADLQATALNATVASVGLDTTFQAVSNTLAAHNRIMDDLMADLVDKTTDRLRRYGGPDSMAMEDGDEFTVPKAQKITAGSNVGFPLRMAIGGLQWTELFFKKKTIGEFAGQVDAMMDADHNRCIRDIKRAIFYATNYTSNDFLIDKIDLDVKRLVNADSAPIPAGPNGETFTASSHTHYLARAGGSLASTDLDGLIDTVREHYASGEIRVYINQAQESTVTGFTGFVKYVDARIVANVNADHARGGVLDPIQIYNRALGLYRGAEVWTKPWIPANYLFCWNKSAPKPLCYRYDPDIGDGLQLVYDNPSYPLMARAYRRVFGVGVWNRINGAVLYGGNTSYADPTITS